jgi:two-component system NarL family sensor kinase
MNGLAARLTPVPDVGPGPIRDLLLDHFYRGARIQRVLRLALVAYFVATLLAFPPVDQELSWLIVLCYLVWAVVIGLLVRRASAAVAPYVWLALLFDLLATGALAMVADVSARETGTAYVVVHAFFLLPVMAAAQLNPVVCGVVSGLAVLAFLGSSAVTRHADEETWSGLLLRTAMLVALGLGCVLLSTVQRRRVLSIGALASDRSRLVGELVDVEERERQSLAEHLHDGALQYVLAARQDLEDVGSDPAAAERVDHALGEAVVMLRSTLTQLHPVVVQEAGLLPALRDLTLDVGRRARLEVRLDADGWPEQTPTAVDPLLLNTARELLTNVAKHAGAGRATVVLCQELSGTARFARLVVTDDGQGLGEADLAERLREGHLGLASRRTHVEAAGGRLTIEPADPRGTRVEVVLPLT